MTDHDKDKERVREIQRSIKWVRDDWGGLTQAVQSWCVKAEYLLTRLIKERAEKLKDYAKRHPLNYPFAKTPGWMDRRENRLDQSLDQWLTEAKKQLGVE